MFLNQHSKPLSFFLSLLLAVFLLVGCNLPGRISATPTAVPSPTSLLPQNTPTTQPPTLTPQPTATTAQAPLNVVFAAGTTAAVQQGTLQPGQSQSYTVSASENQPMILLLESSKNGLYLGVTEADGTVLLDPAQKWSSWQWLLPKTEVYTIQVFAGAGPADYTLTIKVARVVNFASGTSTATLTGTTVSGYVVSYAIYCTTGQTLAAGLGVPSTTAYLDVFGLATGLLLSSSVKSNSWSGVLPNDQDYVIEVIPADGQAVGYSLTVSCH
jgi:hypothetical protein